MFRRSFVPAVSASPIPCLLAVIIVCLMSVAPTRALDGQVPMPPAAGWPAYPRPITRAEVPSACGTPLHNVFCSQDSKLEKELELEFWLLVGNLGSSTDPSVEGLKDWIRRVGRYSGYTNSLTGVPTPQNWYGGFVGGPQKNRARLTMLLGGANMALFRVYDIEALVRAVQKVDLFSLIQHASELPALYHLLEAMKYSDEATYLMPEHQNAQAFAYGIGAFAQWALPIEGIDLGRIVPNVRGGIGLRHAYPLGFAGGKASLSKLMDVAAPCDDVDSCHALAGSEGQFAGVAVLQLLAPGAVPTSAWPELEPHGSISQAGIDLMYDPLEGDCGTYACSVTTSIAPFKKLGGLMLIATAYGRLGDNTAMRALFGQIRELAAQQQWPFLSRFEDLVARVEGTGPYTGKSLLDTWKRNDQRLGFLQLPLSPASGVMSCSNCHYAGVMPNPRVYER